MIRSNLIARRIAAAIPPKYAVPRAASATSSSAMDALASSASSSASAARYFSPPPTTPTAPRRQFSSSDAATELGSILQREINEETEASAEYSGNLPPELSELKSDVSAKWTVLEGIVGIGSEGGETGSGATVRMFRKEAGSKGAKIGVVFHCQDTEDDIKFDENDMSFEDLAKDEEVEGEEEEPPQAVRFGVTVSKGGRTVVLQCRGTDDGVGVESVMVRDGDTESVLSELAGGEGVMTNVLDMRGLSFSNMRNQEYIGFGKRFVNMMSSNYPGRSYKTLVVNAPKWFHALYKVFKPLLRETTRAKIVILKAGEKQDTALKFYLGDSLPKDLLSGEEHEKTEPGQRYFMPIEDRDQCEPGPNAVAEYDMRQFCMEQLSNHNETMQEVL